MCWSQTSSWPENLHWVAEQVPMGFELLAATEGGKQVRLHEDSTWHLIVHLPAKQQQMQLTVFVQAFAHMDNPLKEDLIHHQQMEHNYDSAHELLEGLESDIANFQDIKSSMDTVPKQIQALHNNVQQGYYDVVSFEYCAHLWVTPGKWPPPKH